MFSVLKYRTTSISAVKFRKKFVSWKKLLFVFIPMGTENNIKYAVLNNLHIFYYKDPAVIYHLWLSSFFTLVLI